MCQVKQNAWDDTTCLNRDDTQDDSNNRSDDRLQDYTVSNSKEQTCNQDRLPLISKRLKARENEAAKRKFLKHCRSDSKHKNDRPHARC